MSSSKSPVVEMGASRTSSESSTADERDGFFAESQYNHVLNLEKGLPQQQFPEHHEDTVSTREKLTSLAGYLICNVGLTLYNKAILGPFRFPWLLTAVHAGFSWMGCLVMLRLGRFETTKLQLRETLALIAFSFLFTINIAISNVSLAMVSIPFHQVVRATTPLVTILLFRVLYHRTFSTATYLSLLPVVLGVAMTVSGDFMFTDLGFILTFLGVGLAALKTIVTNRMMTGSLALSFWEILYRMSPLACVQAVLYAYFTGELSAFHIADLDERFSLLGFTCAIAGNGLLAFALNVSSFGTNKVAGALAMTVCANIKQSLTIILGIVLFNVQFNPTQMAGILVTVAGGAVYSVVELRSKK